MPIRLGFIGVGGVAQPHLHNHHNARGVRVAAVCDINPERLQAAAKTFGAAAYRDYRRMLKSESLDGVVVCLIPAAHGTIELELARMGMPFYLEKPVHLDLAVCARVLQAIAKRRTINGVGYHWRYLKPVRQVKTWLKGKKIAACTGAWFGGIPGAPWWRKRKLSGGQLVEQTTHVVDLARHLVGEVTHVYAVARRGVIRDVKGYDVDDASIVTLHFKSGAIGSILSGCLSKGHQKPRGGLEVEGRDWTIEITKGDALIHAARPRRLESGQTWAEQLGNGDRAFVQAIRSGKSSHLVSDYRSGANTLAVTLAANQSMRTGRVEKVRQF